jgi:hypothetical protein
MSSHLKFNDMPAITIVYIYEIGPNIDIIAHRRVKTNSCFAIIVKPHDRRVFLALSRELHQG